MERGKVARALLLAGVVVLVSSCLGPCLENPPATFRDSDLVGVWEADYGVGVWPGVDGLERLTLKADGTYQQVYDDRKGHVQVGAWKQWTTEHFADGRVRLWLEGGMCYPCLIDGMWPPTSFPPGGVFPERWDRGYAHGIDDGTGHPVDLDGTRVPLIVQARCWTPLELVLSYPWVVDPDAHIFIRFRRVDSGLSTPAISP